MAEAHENTVLVSHPTGNANVRSVLKALQASKMLVFFHTTIAINPNALWLKVLPTRFREPLLRRKFPINRSLIKAHPLREAARLAAPALGLSKHTAHEFGTLSVDSIYRKLDKAVAKVIGSGRLKKAEAIYAYEDGALASFRAAKKHSVLSIYDLPIGYWRAARSLLQTDIDARPDWAMTHSGFRDSDMKLARKDEELALADHIFVASTFTKKTLKQYPSELAPIEVIPYGFPKANTARIYSDTVGRKLRLLFVGGLSQRKGIAHIFEAAEALEGQVDLTIIGRKPAATCAPLEAGLKKHTYIESAPHGEILNQMRQHDLFIFPSLFEGFGLVVTEAMSQGTPAITTDRTCGPDIIVHGVNGWLIEAGSTDALISQLKILINDPSTIKRAGMEALRTAQNRPWSVYESEMVAAISKVLDQNKNRN